MKIFSIYIMYQTKRRTKRRIQMNKRSRGKKYRGGNLGGVPPHVANLEAAFSDSTMTTYIGEFASQAYNVITENPIQSIVVIAVIGGTVYQYTSRDTLNAVTEEMKKIGNALMSIADLVNPNSSSELTIRQPSVSRGGDPDTNVIKIEDYEEFKKTIPEGTRVICITFPNKK